MTAVISVSCDGHCVVEYRESRSPVGLGIYRNRNMVILQKLPICWIMILAIWIGTPLVEVMVLEELWVFLDTRWILRLFSFHCSTIPSICTCPLQSVPVYYINQYCRLWRLHIHVSGLCILSTGYLRGICIKCGVSHKAGTLVFTFQIYESHLQLIAIGYNDNSEINYVYLGLTCTLFRQCAGVLLAGIVVCILAGIWYNLSSESWSADDERWVMSGKALALSILRIPCVFDFITVCIWIQYTTDFASECHFVIFKDVFKLHIVISRENSCTLTLPGITNVHMQNLLAIGSSFLCDEWLTDTYVSHFQLKQYSEVFEATHLNY